VKAPTAQQIFDMACIFVSQGRFADAAVTFEKCLLVDPTRADAWSNRANCLSQLGNKFDAILNYNHAIQRSDTQAEFFNNRGATWMDLKCYPNAEKDYLKAIVLNPLIAETYSNLARCKMITGDMEAADTYFTKAIEVNPQYIEARLNRSILYLEQGRLEEGFKEYECRWQCGQLPPRGLPCPKWEGEDLNGKRIILYQEQGLGDAVQFIRYAAVIKYRWPEAIVAVEVNLALVRLAKTVPGVDQVITYGENPGAADFCCPMLSAPRVLGTTMETIPVAQAYMAPDPYRVSTWADRLMADLKAHPHRIVVGICWSGQARPMQPLANSVDARRSTQLSDWEPLAKVPGVVFVSLQQGHPASQARTPPVGMTVAAYDEEFQDFADTAALMDCLDLVISVDTSVAHVAAAIGRPVWMLSRHDGCWRWHGNRSDSPWYPTLRQFRQQTPGDWGGVFAEVAKELTKLVAVTEPAIAAE